MFFSQRAKWFAIVHMLLPVRPPLSSSPLAVRFRAKMDEPESGESFRIVCVTTTFCGIRSISNCRKFSLNLFTTNLKLKQKTQLKSHYKHTMHTQRTCIVHTSDMHAQSRSTTMAKENFVKHSRAISEFIIFTHCLLWFHLDSVHTLSSSIAFRLTRFLHLPVTLFGAFLFDRTPSQTPILVLMQSIHVYINIRAVLISTELQCHWLSAGAGAVLCPDQS